MVELKLGEMTSIGRSGENLATTVAVDVSGLIGSYYLYTGGNRSGGWEGHVYMQKWWAK